MCGGPVTLVQLKQTWHKRGQGPTFCSKSCAAEDLHMRLPWRAQQIAEAHREHARLTGEKLDARLAPLTKRQCYALGYRNGQVVERNYKRRALGKQYWKGIAVDGGG